MTLFNIIATCVILVSIAIIIGIRIYKLRKDNKTITIETFIDLYGDQIIAALKDVILILQIRVEAFNTKEEYEREIISTTIDKIKENYTEMNIDMSLINLLDTDALTEIVYSVFNGNLINIFSVLAPEDISQKPEIFEDEVVAALASAEE